MRLMRTAAVLVLGGLLAAGCIARSPEIFHTPDRLDRWAHVAAIPPGAEVRVWRASARRPPSRGRFVRAGDIPSIPTSLPPSTSIRIRAVQLHWRYSAQIPSTTLFLLQPTVLAAACATTDDVRCCAHGFTARIGFDIVSAPAISFPIHLL